MDSEEDTHGRKPIDEARVRAAEAELIAAREAWHRERGEQPPPDEEPPDEVRRAERAFIAARELWYQDHETRAKQDRGEHPDGEGAQR